MNDNTTVCIYCKERPAGKSEHVFPKGLGGQSIYMDNICDACNNYFSKLEGEVFRNSPIAVMRSAENVSGYGGKKLRKGALTFPEMFQFVKEDNVVYEIGIYEGTRAYTRPQIVQVRGNIHAGCAEIGEMRKFLLAFEAWRNDSGILVTSAPKDKTLPFDAVKFTKVGSQYTAEVSQVVKPKNAMSLVLLNKVNKFWEHFEPRLFFSEEQRLVLRARSLEEATNFLCRTLNQVVGGGLNLQSYSGKGTKDNIDLAFKLDREKYLQCLVKIGLNVMMHYIPEVAVSPDIQPALDFVMKGGTVTGLRMNFCTPADIIDRIEGKHSVIFSQTDQFFLVRVNLFSGAVIFGFSLDGLIVPRENRDFSGLLVDYTARQQNFYSNSGAFLVYGLGIVPKE